MGEQKTKKQWNQRKFGWLGNSLGTAYGERVDDGVGDAVLKPSNIRQIVRELCSLQVPTRWSFNSTG